MTRLQLRRAHLSRLPGQRRRSRPFSRPPSRPPRPAPPRRAPHPLALRWSRPPASSLACPQADRSARARDAGGRCPRSSGPALCDTAHQSLISAADALQSACKGRGLAFRGWRLLGRRGRTGVLEGLSVRRSPDVDSLLLIAGPVRGKAGDWRPASSWEEPAPE